MDDFRFRLDQLVGVKDAARSLPRLIERDEAVVLTRRGTPAAVLVPLVEYTKLRNCQRLVERGIENRYGGRGSRLPTGLRCWWCRRKSSR